MEMADAETETHFVREDRYLCARIVKIEGAGFAKREHIFLKVTFNNRAYEFSSEQVENILSESNSLIYCIYDLNSGIRSLLSL